MSDGLNQITPPSGVLLSERPYPTVIAEPTWSQICEFFPSHLLPCLFCLLLTWCVIFKESGECRSWMVAGGRRKRKWSAAPASKNGTERRCAQRDRCCFRCFRCFRRRCRVLCVPSTSASPDLVSHNAKHTNKHNNAITTPQHTTPPPVSNFRTEDWKLVGGASALGYPVGYAIGFRYHLPRPSGKFGVFMFGTAALAHATQRVTARLLGVLENDAEAKAHGVERKGK